MNNKVIIGILVAIIVIAGGWAIFHKKNTTTYSNTNSSSTSQPANTSSTTSSATQTSTQSKVTIQNMMFTPSQVTINKGDTVVWTNNDSVAHTVTEDNGSGPASGDIQPGSTYSYTFKNSGSYQYHCTIHPSMRGTIVVK